MTKLWSEGNSSTVLSSTGRQVQTVKPDKLSTLCPELKKKMNDKTNISDKLQSLINQLQTLTLTLSIAISDKVPKSCYQARHDSTHPRSQTGGSAQLLARPGTAPACRAQDAGSFAGTHSWRGAPAAGSEGSPGGEGRRGTDEPLTSAGVGGWEPSSVAPAQTCQRDGLGVLSGAVHKRCIKGTKNNGLGGFV